MEFNFKDLDGIFENEPVPDKKELRKYFRRKLLAEIKKENAEKNNSKNSLDPFKLVREDRDSDELYNLTNEDK